MPSLCHFFTFVNTGLMHVQVVSHDTMHSLQSCVSGASCESGVVEGAKRGIGLLQSGRAEAFVGDQGESANHALESGLDARDAEHTSRKLDDHHKQLPAAWFGSFSDGESTFDSDGYVGHPDFPEMGANGGGFNPGSNEGKVFRHGWAGVVPPEWFQESRSGGPQQAWQTYYPDVTDYISRGSFRPMWRRGRQEYVQYQPPVGVEDKLMDEFSDNKAKSAEWFDGSIRQYDAFGRNKLPTEFSGRRYLDWTLRRKNVTLTCGPPGCVANASLTMFDPLSERHRSCRMTIKVHATDFDDEYSREHIEWFKVNSRTVNTRCDPMAKFCNDSVPISQRDLYPCITDMFLADALIGTGTLDISGKLSPMVDECPVDGNLLSGVVSVECFVRPRPDAAAAVAPVPNQSSDNMTEWSAALRCADPACTADAIILIPVAASADKACSLRVVVNQTDFDGDHGSTEEIEWVKVDDAIVKERVAPGRNPCKEKAQGTMIADTAYTVLEDQDVTQAAADGVVIVSAKLSEMVDECGVDGFLLNGRATVRCT